MSLKPISHEEYIQFIDEKEPDLRKFKYIFSGVSPEEFEKMVYIRPLTQARVDMFLKANEIRTKYAYMGITGSSGFFGTNSCFMSINAYAERRQAETTLMHELIHLIYKVGPREFGFRFKDRVFESPRNHDRLEMLIDREASRFKRENKDYVRNLYNSLMSMTA